VFLLHKIQIKFKNQLKNRAQWGSNVKTSGFLVWLVYMRFYTLKNTSDIVRTFLSLRLYNFKSEKNMKIFNSKVSLIEAYYRHPILMILET